MVLIKNAVVTSKWYRYLKAQYYIIFTKFVNEITWTHLFQLQNKLSSTWFALGKVNFLLKHLHQDFFSIFLMFNEKNT